MGRTDKIKLHGFNNITKTVSFNMYDIRYTKTATNREAYINYIDEHYNTERLTLILINVTEIIGATILNISKQDYDPQGSSVTILISEKRLNPDIVVAHLDKSHITIHTYPEYHPDDGVCTFRVDIDVSTCGEICPLKALNYLIRVFNADIMTIDYKVRGFTRDITGLKLFNDVAIESIQNYISEESHNLFHMIDVNIAKERIFHTKCKLREFHINDYLFEFTENDILASEAKDISMKLRKEINEIFYGHNIS
jgi:S-adenosylmethionine decarboxylase